jgi:hypothetical protein
LLLLLKPLLLQRLLLLHKLLLAFLLRARHKADLVFRTIKATMVDMVAFFMRISNQL